MTNPATLVASHPGNRSAQKSGAFSRARPHPERTAEIRDAIMAMPSVVPLDEHGAREIGALIALIEGIDADLLNRGVLDRRGVVRKSLLDIRIRLGRAIRRIREEQQINQEQLRRAAQRTENDLRRVLGMAGNLSSPASRLNVRPLSRRIDYAFLACGWAALS